MKILFLEIEHMSKCFITLKKNHNEILKYLDLRDSKILHISIHKKYMPILYTNHIYQIYIHILHI